MRVSGRRLALGILVPLVLGLGMPTLALAGGKGTCGDAHAAKAEAAPYAFTTGTNQVVSRVIIKAGSQVQGQACFTFTADGTDGCYTVTGIGTGTAVATKTGPDSHWCKDISHVEFTAEDGDSGPAES